MTRVRLDAVIEPAESGSAAARMAEAWFACVRAGVDPPATVAAYFKGVPPPSISGEVRSLGRFDRGQWVQDERHALSIVVGSGSIDVDLSSLPPGTTKLRFTHDVPCGMVCIGERGPVTTRCTLPKGHDCACNTEFLEDM